MRFQPSTFSQLLAPLDRRAVKAIAARHRGDAYAKSFGSWGHLVVAIFAQLSGADSLRGLETEWNAHTQHHYHLGTGKLARSTLADASRRRPAALFAEVFAGVAGLLDSGVRREGEALVRIIDSTPIPLGKLCDWVKSNGRIRGLKVHVVFDPADDCPRVLDITDANVNDAQIGRTVTIEPGAVYCFDKGYCHYGWWNAIAAADAVFVTRPKTSMRLETVAERPLGDAAGDGFTVTADAEVRFASKGDSKLPIRLRRVSVEREDGSTIQLLTNDLTRPAVEIAAFYKGRWQIELLFLWLKQNLRIRRFFNTHPNAIRLQIFAAMIAYVLIRLAIHANRVRQPVLRFTELLACCLFERRHIAAIERPPPVNPARTHPATPPGQLGFAYA
jgi:putative transposase